jgi:hypothetical protein
MKLRYRAYCPKCRKKTVFKEIETKEVKGGKARLCECDRCETRLVFASRN